MPITPFHFGPGALAKSVAPKYFSLRAFILSQVVIDCETAWNLFRGNPRLHTLFHTYLGSILVMVLTGIGLVTYNKVAARMKSSWRTNPLFKPFQLYPAIVAVVFGAWSHVLLDSVMHADMYPFYPLSESSPLLATVSLFTLHVACLISFVAALAIWGIRLVVCSIVKAVRKRSNVQAGA